PGALAVGSDHHLEQPPGLRPLGVEEDAAHHPAAIEGDQVQALRLEGEGHRLPGHAQRLPQHPVPQLQLTRVLRRIEPDEGELLRPAQMSSSSPSTSAARSMMNLKRAETSLPRRSLITRSVSSSLAMVTRSELRRFGSRVVALRSSAGISPSPLNRVM